ncbi:hypothetical protein EDC94DRAFT_530380, partial [Helicostylum pulchrum]
PTETNRGAHMKAIGIIVQPTSDTGVCGKVWTHEHFLKKELSVNYNLKHNVAKVISKQEFGADTFSEFVHTFGPDVFILWKAALLRKRIMLIHMPPMEIACKYVYNICLLGKIPSQFQNGKSDIIPKFTVGVNDIPQLEKKNQTYVACTPDSIFQIKTDLYDVLITLPPSSNQPNFKSSAISTKHNSADFTRFRIMWKQLMSSSSASWAEYVASEPKDIVGTTTALMTGICYWLYEEPHEPSTISNKIYSSWQNLFAGSSRNSSDQLPIFLNQTSTADESQNLLFDEDEEDAMEISNNEVYNVVAARESSEMYRSTGSHLDALLKEDNEILLGFFHSLTYYLLSTLKTILSMNEEDGCDIIHLYPKDMVQLGLDPLADIAFITELSKLYFRKRVLVRGIHNPQACMSLCCCQPFKKKNSNGSIRI